ncbi:MAG: RidA family protein [Ruminococcaceae bacterium]|nr:RidA family protein [Oscillospiraceae bacterium]
MNITSTPNAPAAVGPYSQAIAVNGFLFASGQIPLDPATGEIVGTTIEEQAHRCCLNIKGLLEANGLSFTDVVKTTCFLANMEDFGAFNGVYSQYFTGKPARSCVAVREVPKKVLCEIEIIAVFPGNK